MIKTIISSQNELKNVRCLTTVGLLTSMGLLLSMFSLPITDVIKVGFAFVCTVAIGYLYGPVPAAMSAAIVDLLASIIRPTGPYFPGFTISSFIVGLIYGFILYQKPIDLKRIIFARLSVVLSVSVVLNTYWLTILYGKGFLAMLPIRVMRNIITVPIEVILMYAVLAGIKKLKR